jgi:hypothetical protein
MWRERERERCSLCSCRVPGCEVDEAAGDVSFHTVSGGCAVEHRLLSTARSAIETRPRCWMNFLTDSISFGVMQMNLPTRGVKGGEEERDKTQPTSVVQNTSDPTHLLQSNYTSCSLWQRR